MTLLPGMWRVSMWGYYWEYTAAQIELMAADAPLIVYDHKRKNKDKGKQPSVSRKELEAKEKEWKDKYEHKENKHSIDFSKYTLN